MIGLFKAEVIGTLCRDWSFSYTANSKVAKNAIAINGWKKDDPTTFQNVEAWGKTAELLANNTGKGSTIYLAGNIKDNSYTKKDGTKVSGTVLVVTDHRFLVGKKDGATIAASETKTSDDGFMNIPEGIAEELPFN